MSQYFIVDGFRRYQQVSTFFATVVLPSPIQYITTTGAEVASLETLPRDVVVPLKQLEP